MRNTIVSTSNLKIYRTVIIAIDILVFLLLLILAYHRYIMGESIFNIPLPIIIYLTCHMYYPMFLKLKNVSYDNSSIYYNKKGYEVQVPFEEIKGIKLQSVTGIYGIQLNTLSQGEKEIYFKASVWYPFNFQKKDEVVDELRDKINQYKRTLLQKNIAGLPSYNL